MKRIVLTLLACLLATQLYAATITITVSGLTQKETDAAAWKLAKVNAQRTANQQPTFATAKLWIEDLLNHHILPAMVKEHAEATANDDNIKALWESATPAQRAAAKAALGG